MDNVASALQFGCNYLQNRRIAFPKECAQDLLASLLQLKRSDLFFKKSMKLQLEIKKAYQSLIERKGNGEPLAYLLSAVSFLSCQLTLSPAVLVPRHETEIMVSLALEEIPNTPKVVWDLCTGSGCIGIAIKKMRPELSLFLSDISHEALALAKENGKNNQIEATYYQGDLLTPFQGQKSDYVFCNPPYLSESEYLHVEKEVAFEPKIALVAQEEGLEFYRRLAAELPAYLNPGAKVFLEIGEKQKEALLGIFNQSCWNKVVCKKDWAKKDRFFFLEFRKDFT